tara:strand:- start:283 stop:573 length:291 start_codon:yes stop_codon:yes gene_type:complete
MKTTNAKSSIHTSRKAPFRANNLMGRFVGSSYVVYSYGYYPIYANVNGVWFKNSEKYSRTTSKQQTQSRPELYGQKEFELLDTDKLNAFIDKHNCI